MVAGPTLTGTTDRDHMLDTTTSALADVRGRTWSNGETDDPESPRVGRLWTRAGK
jgi:hypothetical protein